MKLRTRLYLWVSSLFIIFFVIAYFLEIYLVNSHLNESEKQLEQEIFKANEAKREELEEYLGIQIADMQGVVDALLYRIEEFSYLKSGFYPSEKNEKGKTWLSASTLILHNKWINYLQNTINGEVASLLTPSYQDLHPIEYYPINDDLYWVFIEDQNTSPYLALKLTLRDIAGLAPSFVDIDIGKFTDIYFLFDYSVIENFTEPPPLTIEGFNYSEADINTQKRQELSGLRQIVLEKIDKAKTTLQTMPLEQFASFTPDEFRDYIEKTYEKQATLEGHEESIPVSILEKGNKGVSQAIDQEFVRTFYKTRDRDDSIVLIWAYTTFLSTDLFGSDPLSKNAPAGIASILPGKKIGAALLSEGTFYTEPFFNDNQYDLNHASNLGGASIPSSIALIKYPEGNELFIGNTLSLTKNGQKSLLTLGMRTSDLLQKLSLASNQTVALVHENKVVNIFDSEGEQKQTSSFFDLPLSNMQDSKGIVEIDGEQYFFLQLQPYEDVDLHFYLFELKDKAFAFVTFIQNSVSDVIQQISWNMRIIAIVALICALGILELIARKISKPIATLARATKSISEGHYDQIELPKTSKSNKDEIAILCSSFSEMIQGLKDREKVKGVLNKVVSKEIAEEILNGKVSLGGEEKQASIIFADIRNFTELTEKMPPTDVIDLLNTCMTKISQVVDDFGGVIDKYIGDEAMALYGAPISHDDHAKQACLSALKMIDCIEEWNLERRKQNLPEVHIGIGICSGTVVAGNMGAENRLNYTVLGANVNLGARLCAQAKPKEILISKNTLEAPGVKDVIDYKQLEPISLKGFSQPVEAYMIIGKKHYG